MPDNSSGGNVLFSIFDEIYGDLLREQMNRPAGLVGSLRSDWPQNLYVSGSVFNTLNNLDAELRKDIPPKAKSHLPDWF